MRITPPPPSPIEAQTLKRAELTDSARSRDVRLFLGVIKQHLIMFHLLLFCIDATINNIWKKKVKLQIKNICIFFFCQFINLQQNDELLAITPSFLKEGVMLVLQILLS